MAVVDLPNTGLPARHGDWLGRGRTGGVGVAILAGVPDAYGLVLHGVAIARDATPRVSDEVDSSSMEANRLAKDVGVDCDTNVEPRGSAKSPGDEVLFSVSFPRGVCVLSMMGWVAGSMAVSVTTGCWGANVPTVCPGAGDGMSLDTSWHGASQGMSACGQLGVPSCKGAVSGLSPSQSSHG